MPRSKQSKKSHVQKLFESRYFVPLIIFILAFSLMSFQIDLPTEYWDERARYVAGLNQMFNVVKGNFDSASWELNFFHPPIGKYIYGIANGAYLFTQVPGILSMSYDDAVSIVDRTKSFVPGRLAAVAMASGSVVLTYLIGNHLSGRRVGISAALILMSMPFFLASMRAENLESPMLFFLMSSLYTFILAVKFGGNSKFYILSALMAGLSIGSKFNGAILVFVLPSLYILMKRSDVVNNLKTFLKNIPINVWLYPAIVIAVMVASWPWLWSDPVGNLHASLTWWTYQTQEYYFGSISNPDPTYYLTYMVFTTPVLLLAFFAASFASRRNKEALYIVFTWLIVSMLIFSLTEFKQNGPRYVVSVYPAFAIVSAVGFMWLYDKIGTVSKLAAIGLIVASAAYIGYSLYTIHPYYIDYYNEAVGGPENVYEDRMFIIGSNGEGIGEAVGYINSVAPHESAVEFHFTPSHVTRNLREDITDLNPPAQDGELRLSQINNADSNLYGADFLVENTYFRWYINSTLHHDISEDYELVKTVDANGADLVWVYQRKVS